MSNAKLVFFDFIRYVVNGDIADVCRGLAANPSFANVPSDVGATREDPRTFFFIEIARYLYAGDTALHMAAAAFRRPVAELLVAHGGGLPCEESARSGTDSLRGRYQPLESGGTGRDDRVPRGYRRGSKRAGQIRCGAPAQSGANAVIGGGTGAAGWWR